MKRILLISLLLSTFLVGCGPALRFINFLPSNKLIPVEYANSKIQDDFQFIYPDSTNNQYLRKLRTEYGLDTLTMNLDNDLDKIKTILNWTSKQWSHSATNTPTGTDPYAILTEAKQGASFRCVEYGIVTAGALNSIGIASRVLSLKSADVEKVKFGAGHVVAEAYSPEYEKWIFMDGQFNAIAMLNGTPLNAVELRKAIMENPEKVQVINKEGPLTKERRDNYIKWIPKYLFYLSIKFDNRYISKEKRTKVDGKSTLMLVPINSKNPTVFQRKYDIDYCKYTNNINDFYRTPEIN